MDKSFEALVVALRSLATAPGFDEHDRLRGAELAIKRYIEPYQDTEERQSELERIGEAALDEAKKRPSQVEFWTSVEDIASRLSLS